MSDNTSIVSIQEILGNFGIDQPKQNIINLATEKAVEVCERGHVDLLEVHARGRQILEFFTAFSGKTGEYAKDDMYNQDSNSIKKGNVVLELSNTGDRYDYMKDPVYASLYNQLQDRKKLLDLKRTAHEDYETYKDIPEVPVKTFGKEIIKVKLL